MQEMVGCPVFTPPIIRAVAACRVPFWVGFSAFAHGPKGELVVVNDGFTPLADALPELVALAKRGGADLIGAMHSKPSAIAPMLRMIRRHGWEGPMLAYPDDEKLWDVNTGKAVAWQTAPEVFASHCLGWHREFPSCCVLGACCGFRVPHIVALGRRCMVIDDGERGGRGRGRAASEAAEDASGSVGGSDGGSDDGGSRL